MLSKWIKVNWVDFLWINFKIKLYHYRIKHLHSHNQIKGSFMLNYPRLFPVVMCGCESWTIKRGWAPNNWCFWTVVLEKILESPLDSKEIQPVHPKGNQIWIFIGRTDVEAETPIVLPPDGKNWLIWKDPDAGKDWRQEEKGRTENEMVRWYHWPMDMSLSKLLELVMDREAWHAAGHEVIKDRTWLSDWTELNWPWGLITFCKGHLYWYYDHFILKHLIIFVHFYLFSW